MMGGWIKIYQTIREHWIWNDPRKLKWWIDLLMLAEWRDSKRLVGSDLVTIKRGQLIASAHYLRERWAYKDDNGVQRKPSEHTILKFLSLLEADQMISRAKHPATRATMITIVNYDDYQQNSTAGCNEGSNDPCNDPCTEDKNNKNIKDNREGKSGKSEKRFSPPSIEEVDSYIREKGYTVDAERFVNFYESKGWYVGKNKMKNWRAAVATWQKEDNKRNGINQQRSCDKRRGTEATATRPEDYEGKF